MDAPRLDSCHAIQRCSRSPAAQRACGSFRRRPVRRRVPGERVKGIERVCGATTRSESMLKKRGETLAPDEEEVYRDFAIFGNRASVARRT